MKAEKAAAYPVYHLLVLLSKFLLIFVHATIDNTFFFWKTIIFVQGPAVSSVAKHTLSVREVWGSTPGPVKSTQCRQRLATVAMFLRSCVAQVLSRGDGRRHSLHASA